jgi:signal transduction histidine kinase
VGDPEVQLHAEEAFASSFAVSVAVATVSALLAAGLVSWFIVRRVSRPVEELAQSAESVAAGQYDVSVPGATFSRELHQLSESFINMAHRLAETEVTRIHLLADLTHELRTPLATLEAYIDGLEDDVLPRDAVAWQTMRNQVDRLQRLSTDLREAAAAEEHALGLVLERFDLRIVAETVVAAVAPRYAAKSVNIALRNPDGGVIVDIDPQRIEQVLANLLDNALRHTPSGGTVTVQVSVTSEDSVLSVADTGEGIPVDQLSLVFDRFHRVDPSRVSSRGGGSGLGLTIARAIVVDHGGTLEARSEGTGRGATLVMTIPLAPAGPVPR